MRRCRIRRSGQGAPAPRGRAHPAMFWLGTGIGVILSAAAVAIAADFTFRRRQRLLAAGGFTMTDDDIMHDLSEAVHSGLENLSHAAHQIGQTFSDARRELVRFGLDAVDGSGDGTGMYYDDEEAAAPENKTAGPADYEKQWDERSRAE